MTDSTSPRSASPSRPSPTGEGRDFLLEILSEEIPARMQARARNDLSTIFADELGKAGLSHGAIDAFSTPRRLVLIARGLADRTEAVREEIKGPRSSAPPQALEGFLRKTGLTQDQLEDRDGVYFAVVDRPGQEAAVVVQGGLTRIFADFPWPKSMRWGDGSTRWVRPLQGIIAILGEDIVPFEIAGVRSGATTVGHRFHHPGPITVNGASDYVEKLRACHVIVDHEERERIVRDSAQAAAEAAGLKLLCDEGLVVENAGLTEWPVPLLGRFDPEFLDVPREVIVLTMRTNQKYFACTDADGALAPAFVCTANIDASDGGAAIVEGNRRVLAARLSDARFFWEQDLKVPLEEQSKKLSQIVFHEKLGTVADKVERVAKLARWLCEEGIVKSSPVGEGRLGEAELGEDVTASHPHPSAADAAPSLSQGRGNLADLAERAARLAKADLVTGMVGEFPEVQGVIGGYLARAQGEPNAVADAVRDHYKPVGQGDEVPTAPVTVAVSLADKLDDLMAFMGAKMLPSGSKDPFALRRAAIAVINLISANCLRLPLSKVITDHFNRMVAAWNAVDGQQSYAVDGPFDDDWVDEQGNSVTADTATLYEVHTAAELTERGFMYDFVAALQVDYSDDGHDEFWDNIIGSRRYEFPDPIFLGEHLPRFFADRLKVQQREAGVRHDLVDAVFALGGEDDLVRLLARVKALQGFVSSEDGRDLHAAYKRAANILKKEKWDAPEVMSSREEQGIPQTGEEDPLVLVEEPGMMEAVAEMASGSAGAFLPQEQALIAALDSAEPEASAAVEREDFTAAMAALAKLRGPIDAFFDHVTVNDPDSATRERRLNLLLRFKDAVHRVADFSKIEG